MPSPPSPPNPPPAIPADHFQQTCRCYLVAAAVEWGRTSGCFLTNVPFRRPFGTAGPVTIWLNLNNKAEVDELFERWKQAGGNVIEAPEDIRLV